MYIRKRSLTEIEVLVLSRSSSLNWRTHSYADDLCVDPWVTFQYDDAILQVSEFSNKDNFVSLYIYMLRISFDIL